MLGFRGRGSLGYKVSVSLNWTICLLGASSGLSEMTVTYPRVSVDLTRGKDVVLPDLLGRGNPDFRNFFSPLCLRRSGHF